MESKKMKLTTVVLALLCILCVALAFIGYHRVKAEQNPVFDTANYALYGNGDERISYDSESGSMKIYGHGTYKNGLYVKDRESVPQMQVSLTTMEDKWIGIGFLNAPVHGTIETSAKGVMLYIHAKDGKYVARIFQMNIDASNKFVEKTNYESGIDAGTKMTVSMKYDTEAQAWFYYMNEEKVYSGEKYLMGEEFISADRYTFFNFAYEAGSATEIQLYSLTGSSVEIPDEPLKVPSVRKDEGIFTGSNYNVYGNGEEYVRIDESGEYVNIFAHGAYKNGFIMNDITSAVAAEISVESIDNYWMGIGFLSAGNHGAPETTDKGTMLYITKENSFYKFRIFQANAEGQGQFVEKKEYISDIAVGTKIQISLQYDTNAKGWYYYIDGKRIVTGETYIDGDSFIDKDGKTYFCYAYEQQNKAPLKLYSLGGNGVQMTPDQDFCNADNYTNYGNGDNYVRYNTEEKCIEAMMHGAYKNGFKVSDNNAVLQVNFSMDVIQDKWLGIGYLSAGEHGAMETTADGVMLYITSAGGMYSLRIFKMHPAKEMKSWTSDVPVGTKVTLSLKYDAQAECWYYYFNGVKVDAGEKYLENVKFTDKNDKAYLCFAYDYNQAPVKVYSVCSYDVSNGIEYSITDAEGRPLFFPTTIKLGDELNLDGMKICIKSLDKKEFVDLEKSMISGYDSSAKGEEALGKKTIIVTYEGKEIYTATILVSDKVESFTLIKPEKTEYTVNSVKKLDLTGCAADVKYVSGKEEKGYKITANMVDASDVDFTKAGTYEVKVVIDGVTQTFEVVIKSAGGCSGTVTNYSALLLLPVAICAVLLLRKNKERNNRV